MSFGRVVPHETKRRYRFFIPDCTYTLSDFDSTVIDPMPEAEKTYEEMEADINEKLESFEEELEMTDEYLDEASDAAEVK